MSPILLLVNYYAKRAATAAVPPDLASLAARCTQHAFTPTTCSPAYLPLLLEQHSKLRMLFTRLLLASAAAGAQLHVAYLFDLKRPGRAGVWVVRVQRMSHHRVHQGTQRVRHYVWPRCHLRLTQNSASGCAPMAPTPRASPGP